MALRQRGWGLTTAPPEALGHKPKAAWQQQHPIICGDSKPAPNPLPREVAVGEEPLTGRSAALRCLAMRDIQLQGRNL
jgi:hypothetical protein